MIWGVLALCVLAGVFLFQWGAGKVAGEKLKEADLDLQAAKRIAKASLSSPTDKQSLFERLSDDKREL